MLNQNVIQILIASAGALHADTMAYAITQSDQYGTIDLTTGTFTQIVANEGQAFAALGEANGSLFVNTTGVYALSNSFNLYSVNPTTGAPTLIGPTGLSAGGQ